ncbi:MAG TPA: hypothetical protein DEB10_04260 [Ruminococcaceae bacterium]|nr:hypothetical protein [Oscillospiraceae bacterium]
MNYNKPISSGDPQALEKLMAKLEQSKELQDTMKVVNAYWRKFGTCKGAPGITDVQAEKLEKRIETGYSWEKQPFTSYELTNNNAEIKRLERRIQELSYNKEVGFSGWNFEGGYAEANTDMNRLQLYFDEKPDEQRRTVLKSNGFKWAPSQGAWQRQLRDNAIYSAGRIDFIRPSDGRSVREHQPKPPVKDTGAR